MGAIVFVYAWLAQDCQLFRMVSGVFHMNCHDCRRVLVSLKLKNEWNVTADQFFIIMLYIEICFAYSNLLYFSISWGLIIKMLCYAKNISSCLHYINYSLFLYFLVPSKFFNLIFRNQTYLRWYWRCVSALPFRPVDKPPVL